jgi:hypothetical protein
MTRIVIVATALALVATSVASAGSSAAYRGKTKGGTSITFTLNGNRISAVRSAVPTICVETTGSGQTRAGVELYQPPATFIVGTTGKTKALQPAAMNQANKATKNYTFTSKRTATGISGTLKISFSFIRPGLDIYHAYIFLCTSTTTFTASAR